MSILRTFVNIARSVIEIALCFRLILKLLAVNPRTPFVAWLYGATERLVAPFANILPNWKYAGFVVDSATLAALIIYAIAGSLLMAILPHPRKGPDVHNR